MGERFSPTTSSRGKLTRILMSVRKLTEEEASDWCDKWEKHAAKSGLRSEAAYFWDSARGWIDAQLDVRPKEDEQPPARPVALARPRR
jgi:hypothetical protein